MREQIRIIYDLSSVVKQCYFAGLDKEWGHEIEFNGRKVWINSWQHGAEHFRNSLISTLQDNDAAPIDVIGVLDGEMSTTIRKNIFAGYKQREERPDEQKEQYRQCIEWAVQFLRGLGANVVKRDGLEADDVMKYLCDTLPGRKIAVSNDGDMAVLMLNPDVTLRYQGRNLTRDENPIGPFPLELNRIYKALVGDKSDKLPGAKGFGDAAFIDLLSNADMEGMAALEEIIVEARWDELKEDAAAFKPLAKILEHADTVRRCYTCAGFFDKEIGKPGRELQWLPGMVLERPEGEIKDERFEHWYQKRRVIHSGNFAELMGSRVWAQIRRSPWVTLDLETSTPPESDAWLREVNAKDVEVEFDEETAEAPKGVDVIASKITGMGVTFGENSEHTLYFTVDHKTDRNITPHQLFLFLDKLLREDVEMRFPVHNSSFELIVLFLNLMEWAGESDAWDQGFFPRIDDTMFMASYADENESIGLKKLAQRVLGYTQTEYEDVVRDPETGRQRKMNELTPQEVFAYGTDDTIVTSALRNILGLVLECERTETGALGYRNTFDIYRDVEIDAAYLSAAGMMTGANFDRQEMRRQERIDDRLYDEAWARVREYLLANQWDGTQLPEITLDAASMKAAYEIVTGEPLNTRNRKVEKVIADMRENVDGGTLADLYDWAMANNGDMQHVEAYVRRHFKGEPVLNVDSPKQMAKLFYQVMELPVRARNRPTAAQRKEQGRTAVGTPKTDALAIASAKFYDAETMPEQIAVLESLHTMRSVATRRKLYYRPYRTLPHWQTGMIHSSFGQCFTVTRRFAPNKPNLAQLPKADGKGDFRACFVPHHRNAVIVSPDFKAQELRVIADTSGDEAMTRCFVGENKLDMHHLTGVSIAQKKFADWAKENNTEITYDWFATVIEDKSHPMFKQIKATRGKAKTTNFASEYGAMAPKMAATLMVPEEEAQSYLDAKHGTFWRAEEWKKEEVIPEAKKKGYALTRLGARRHLARAFAADDWGTKSRAERQAVNFRIQGSCGEMTKKAMGRVWRAGLLTKYDVQFYMPVHDELVFSVGREDAAAFTMELHRLMTQQYADMRIPIESSVGIGLDFKNLEEIGENPTPELINAAVDKLFARRAAANEGVKNAA